jgi:TatA/E family protein of Tat protein translocase
LSKETTVPRGQELIIILVVLVLLFGARKLPELARSLGASAKEFRKGVQEGSRRVRRAARRATRPRRNSRSLRDVVTAEGAMNDPSIPTWEDVARTHGRKIYNYAYRLTGNPHDAKDLVQEVLLRVRRGLEGYTPGSFDGWLWRITRNAFLDDVRKRNAVPPHRSPTTSTGSLTPSSPAADDVLASIRLGEDIQKALLDLPRTSGRRS